MTHDTTKEHEMETLTKIGSYELSRSRLQTNDGRYELRLSGVANPGDKPGTHLYDHENGISTHSQQWGDEVRQLEWMDGYNEGCYNGPSHLHDGRAADDYDGTGICVRCGAEWDNGNAR